MHCSPPPAIQLSGAARKPVADGSSLGCLDGSFLWAAAHPATPRLFRDGFMQMEAGFLAHPWHPMQCLLVFVLVVVFLSLLAPGLPFQHS